MSVHHRVRVSTRLLDWSLAQLWAWRGEAQQQQQQSEQQSPSRLAVFSSYRQWTHEYNALTTQQNVGR